MQEENRMIVSLEERRDATDYCHARLKMNARHTMTLNSFTETSYAVIDHPVQCVEAR